MTIRLTNSQEMSENFYLKVAQGEVAGHSWVHKFGAAPSMTSNTQGTIWDINDTVYPWGVFDTPQAITITCDPADNGKTLVLYSLDTNYDIVRENIILNSTTPYVTSATYKRVYRAFMLDEPNVADINFTAASTVVARISAGNSQTLMAVYTVPAGYTAYITQGICSVEARGDASVDFMVRFYNYDYPGYIVPFRVNHTLEVTSGSPYQFKPTFPFPIPEKCDLDLRAFVRTNNSRITASFDVLLVKGLLV